MEQFLHFCNGCGIWYKDDKPEPGAVHDTHDPEVGVLEFCTEECRDAWLAQPVVTH